MRRPAWAEGLGLKECRDGEAGKIIGLFQIISYHIVWQNNYIIQIYEYRKMMLWLVRWICWRFAIIDTSSSCFIYKISWFDMKMWQLFIFWWERHSEWFLCVPTQISSTSDEISISSFYQYRKEGSCFEKWMVEEEQKSHHNEKVKSHRNSGEAANQTHESRHGQLVMKKVQYYIIVLYTVYSTTVL